MTEAEWSKVNEPAKLLRALGRKPSKRKRRLFGCACCRRIWQLILDNRSREAVRVAERFADDAAGAAELARAKEAAKVAAEEQRGPDYTGHWAANACYCVVFTNAGDAAKAWYSATSAQQMHGLVQRGIHDGANSNRGAVMADVWNQETSALAALLRDIFGNPSRPVSLDPARRTSDVLALARGIYEERAFGRMPILADALQDAGCDSEEVLTHCRGAGPHVRGCWVVDLVLGKQ